MILGKSYFYKKVLFWYQTTLFQISRKLKIFSSFCWKLTFVGGSWGSAQMIFSGGGIPKEPLHNYTPMHILLNSIDADMKSDIGNSRGVLRPYPLRFHVKEAGRDAKLI
jgi:hypothetical protein